MNIDIFTLRLVFILIPGIITYGIVSSLAPKTVRRNFVTFLQIFVYGMLSYTLYYFAAKSIGGNLKPPVIFTTELLNSDAGLNFGEIVYATVFGVILGIFIVININYSLLIRVMRFLRITKRHSDVDTWSYVMNSKVEPWVTVRDQKKKLNYDGYIDVFSQGEGDRELLLSRVVVYDDSTGDELYRVPLMYLPLKSVDFLLEFRWASDDD